MKFFAFAALAAALPSLSYAQNETFIADLIQTLQAAKLNQLANIAQQLNASGVGQYLLSNISNGDPHLFFAPLDTALTNIPTNISTEDLIGYHIVPGSVGTPTIYPNTTIGRTLLTDPLFVQLEGDNKAQVVAWAQREDNKTHVLNQRTDTTVTNVTTFGNLTIYVIDSLLNPPEKLSVTIPTLNDSTSLNALEPLLRAVPVPVYDSTTNQTSNVSLFDALDGPYHGFTLFAPDDTALSNAASQLQAANSSGNASAVETVIFNHLINGTTIYSPELIGNSFTSTGGETFSFAINSSGTFVTSGNTTAMIVQPDVLLPNGVVHIIDTVLLNTASDPPAASSALASATSAATASPTQTAPIGFSQTANFAPSDVSGAASGGESLVAGNALKGWLSTLGGVVMGAVWVGL
ncbi:hypothetical protein ABKN59_011145 [Abortiporus biennis]